MLSATLKSLLARKLRLLLSGLAVILGVLFVSGSFVLTDTLGRSFDKMFAGAYETIDVQVRPAVADDEIAQRVIAPADLDRVRSVAGVARATGIVDGSARVIGPDGKVVTSFGPPRVGANWTGENELIRLREGRGPRVGDEIVLNGALAKAAGVRVGDRVEVLTTQPKRAFTLVGVAEYSGGRDSLGGELTVWLHDSVAARLILGTAGVYSGLTVDAAAGESATRLRDTLRAELGGGFQVQTGAELAAEQQEETRKSLGFFNKILLGFAGVALFVGIFLILNTFSIIVAQRTRELALMRALGGSRRQMITSVLVEAVVVGLLSSVVGLGLGIGVGALMARVFANTGGADLPVAGVAVPPAAVISAFAVGLLVTVVAALLPAVRASRIPPVAALREAATPDRPLTKLTVAGAVVGALGGALLALGLSGELGDGTMSAILAGVVVSFIGVALLTPALARPVVGAIGRLFSWSTPGRLGRLNSARNPRRTAITAAALMVGIALITGVNTVLDSATHSLKRMADTQLGADLIVAGDEMSDTRVTFPPSVLTAARAIPGVTAVTGQYDSEVKVDGKPAYGMAFSDMPAMVSMFSLRAIDGSLEPPGADQVVVDETRAREAGLRVGSTVRLELPRGAPRTMTVAGVYARSDTMAGWLLPAALIPNLEFTQPSYAFVDVADGTPLSRVRAEVDKLLADSPEVTVTDKDGYIDQIRRQFDFVLTMVQILLALAILIAVLGIVNTLALSVLERTRELGLIRAVGLGRGQTMRMVTVEAVTISVFGALLGVVVGSGLGAACVRALRDSGITSLALPWASMGGYLALGALIGVVAAVLPAIRAARINVLRAISHD